MRTLVVGAALAFTALLAFLTLFVMFGAVVTNVAILGESPLVSAGFLLVAAAIAWRRWERTIALLPTSLRNGEKS